MSKNREKLSWNPNFIEEMWPKQDFASREPENGLMTRYCLRMPSLDVSVETLQAQRICWTELTNRDGHTTSSKRLKQYIIYIDICKDTFIMVSILIIIGGLTSLYKFPTKLTSIVVYCQLATIVLPLAYSSILCAKRELKMKQEKNTFWGKLLTCAIFILGEAYEGNKAKKSSMIKFHKNRAIVLDLCMESKILRKTLVYKWFSSCLDR